MSQHFKYGLLHLYLMNDLLSSDKEIRKIAAAEVNLAASSDPSVLDIPTLLDILLQITDDTIALQVANAISNATRLLPEIQTNYVDEIMSTLNKLSERDLSDESKYGSIAVLLFTIISPSFLSNTNLLTDYLSTLFKLMLCNGSIRFSAAIPINSVGSKSPAILANYVEESFEAIKSGHSALIPTLMELYQYDEEVFINNTDFLIDLLATNISHRGIILPVLHNISRIKPELFFEHVVKFESCLSLPNTSSQTIMILTELTKKDPEMVYPLVPLMVDVVEFDDNLLFLVPGVLGNIGRTSERRGEEMLIILDKFLDMANENQTTLIIKEIYRIAELFRHLLEPYIDKINYLKKSNSKS